MRTLTGNVTTDPLVQWEEVDPNEAMSRVEDGWGLTGPIEIRMEPKADLAVIMPQAPRWSYGGFGRFRIRVAADIGLDLPDMEGFGGARSWEDVEHPLVPFLNHSDCDGDLSPAECATVSPALREIVKAWPESPTEYDRPAALALCDYMDACVKADRKLIFC
jgi:hypothetical protein